MRPLLATFLLGLTCSIPCAAALFSPACSRCGCHQTKQVCRVVPDVKKVTETKFVVECEDICLPGKSRCEDRVVADSCVPGGQRCERVAEPTCNRVVTRKKLKKVTTTVEKPGFKCVVETVCTQCGEACGNCGR